MTGTALVPAGTRAGSTIDLTASSIPADVLQVQGHVGELWDRTTDDNGYDEDGAEYGWASGDHLATDEGVLSCGPLRVTKVAPS